MMLNRRHLRIKVLQSLYAFYQSKCEDLVKIETQTLNSLERIYDLYIYFLLTFSELKRVGLYRIDEGKKKNIVTEKDVNPNRKFVDNEIIDLLENQSKLIKLSEQRKLNWLGDDNQQMFRKIYRKILESDIYDLYMNNGFVGFEEDRAFIIELFKSEIANSDILYDYLKDKNIHWVDDIDLVCSMVIKTIKSFEDGENPEIIDLYKDKDDELGFVLELLKKTIILDKENELLIDNLTANWELDRIAKMDVILMKMAITELQIFENVPTKVTLNEYIEISKFYSTPKSNSFINGVLDKAISFLLRDGKINKVGRGLKK